MNDEVRLRISGRIEALHLEPGDKILVTIDHDHLDERTVEYLRDQLRAQFPDHEILLTAGISLTPVRGTGRA